MPSMMSAVADFPDHFETARLLVRAPGPGDGRAVHEAVCASLAALRAWPASLPWALQEPSIEVSEDYCRSAQLEFLARRDLPMLIFRRGILVGATGLHRMDWSNREFEVGYWGHSAWRGQGLISEAVAGLCRFAFVHLAARRLVCLPDARNLASRRVAERAGFSLESVLRGERSAPDGTLCDTCVYALKAGEIDLGDPPR